MRREIRMSIVDPLEWPVRVPRAEERVAPKFGRKDRERGWIEGVTFERARDRVYEELVRFGADDVVVRTNYPMRRDGWFRLANRSAPDDPGIAVYFELDNERQVIAIDRYDDGGANLYAVARTIEAIRQIGRDGGPTIRAAAVSGFRELPGIGETSGTNWWEVLELAHDVDPPEIRKAYKRLARKYHPDNKMTSDVEKFREVQAAFRQGLTARGGSE